MAYYFSFCQGCIFMMTDTEIKLKGFQILTKSLGNVEAERFFALIQRKQEDIILWMLNFIIILHI